MTTKLAKHTPGPWAIDNGDSHALGIFAEDNNAICYLSANAEEGIGLRTFAADRANARLIAAAPALLEALRGLISLTDQGREGGLILSRADRKPITNGDQDVIDRAYISADTAICAAVGAQEENTRQ